MRHTHLLTLFLGLVVVVSLTHAADLRGVHPSDASLFSGGTFACKDGSKSGLPLSKVNDDYCDCADGSDEPGTSACANGQFFCRNIGHVGLSLFSSRVNDGICDCCDGTDEYDGKVKCQDTCYALGEDTRNAKRQEIEAFKKGLAIRKEYEEQAKAVRAEKLKKLEELKETLAQKQKDKDELQVQVDALAGKAKAAEELLAQYKPKVAPEGPQQEQVENAASPIEDEEGDEDDDEDEEDEGEEDEGEAEEGAEEEKPKPAELLERTDDVKEALDEAEKYINDLRELRARLSNAEREIDNTAREITSVQGFLDIDLGDIAFHGIYDQPFELHTNQYTYKLTPFRDVKQHFTRLGDWGRWLDSAHTKMEYSGGERCWNGPDRKTIVTLTCGDANKIVSVHEPNKCEYEMEFITPAACSPARLESLEKELARLESSDEVIISLDTNHIF